MIKKTILFLTIFFELMPISLVYNLKIRRVFFFGGSIAGDFFRKIDKGHNSVWLLSAVPMVYKRNRHVVTDILDKDLNLVPVDVCEKNVLGGSIFSLSYLYKKSFWFQLTTAYEADKVTSCGTFNFTKKKKGMDDFITSVGYNIFPTKDLQIVPYIINGIPINRKLDSDERFDNFIGTRYYGLGAGTEFIYSFVNRDETNLNGVLVARSVHFFPRRWTPVLPCSVTVQPGNVTDFLIAGQYRKKNSIVEAGYDATFFTNQATLLTTGSIDEPRSIRQSFYANFAHLITKVPVIPSPVMFSVGFFVASLKQYDTKISSFWTSFTILF
ncbi:hypothetical protein A3F66_01150 [candidate division TM6 bacterium RIFCSPHIGHO2_12_FULL_32_22]|nr:MAG: hypothetical protein A3F66_01150 [candidate division TM6 bacterium RIFCSPHIGHO2_12_FULL_32_22]